MSKGQNKRKTLAVILLLLLVTLLALFGWNFFTKEKGMKFTHADRILRNPSRGFYIQLDSSKVSKIEKIKEQDVRLVLVAFDLADYRDTKIPKEKLEELNSMLQALRENGIKAIVRAAYGFEDTGDNDADSLERVREHILPFAECLNENSDVILCVQAGFLGPWGEWHSSKFLTGTKEEQSQVRKNVVKELAAALSDEIIINLRRPRFIREAIEAGIAPERLGYHDDGLLATESDYGTYDDPQYDREAELAYLATAGLSGINGGEMPKVSDYSDSENAILEFPKLHLTYLNLKYNEEVLENWKQSEWNGQNAFDYISNRLGYRFWVTNITVPVNWYRNPWIAPRITLSLANSGFSAIEPGYCMEIIIRAEDGSLTELPAALDLEKLNNGQETKLKIKFPKRKKGSSFWVGLRIYDGKIDSKAKQFCIELANNEMVYENGVNYLFKVSTDGTVQGFE